MHIHAGETWGTGVTNEGIIDRVVVENVKSVSVGPGRLYRFAAFVPENKGKPASVAIYQYPSSKQTTNSSPVAFKTLGQAEEVSVRWSPTGHAALVFSSTAVDKSGSSYYGSTGLHLLVADGSTPDCAVPLPKAGPVQDVAWCPDDTKNLFIVVSGTQPAQACLYNGKCEQMFLFGESPKNTVSWSPSGRFVALCGFGNLAGQCDFWDMNKKKRMGVTTSHCAVQHGWSPCGRYFYTATTAPRMNVDNGVKVYKYDGTGPVLHMPFDVLYEATFRPCRKGVYPDRAASPPKRRDPSSSNNDPSSQPTGSSLGGSSSSPSPLSAAAASLSATKPVERYRPPGAGALGASFAARLRDEREAASGAKVVAKSSAGTALARANNATTTGGPSIGKVAIVGMAPDESSAGSSKNAAKKEKLRKKEEEEKAQKEAAEATAAAIKAALQLEESKKKAARGTADETPEDREKRSKTLKKKLKAIEEIKAKDRGTLNEDQVKKLAQEQELLEEIRKIDLGP